MTRKTLIVTTIVVLAAGALFGRYVMAPLTAPIPNAGNPSATSDTAAEAAGRAMTFTQPKEPSK